MSTQQPEIIWNVPRRDQDPWAALRGRIRGIVDALFEAGEGFAITDIAGTDLYVQWHGEPEGEFYAEASSGLYGDEPLPVELQEQLAALGWSAPGDGWGGADAMNWSKHWLAPVDLDEVVELSVTTLRDVFGAQPEDVTLSAH